MKLTVKNLKGTRFEIHVHPNDTVVAVKKSIEEVQGSNVYPWEQQLLIHDGKFLKDESTLEEINVKEDDFIVVMLGKSKVSSLTGASSDQTSAAAPTPAPQPTPVETPEALSFDDYDHVAMDMGNWDRYTFLHPLRAAHNNQKLEAVEYLYPGIPDAAPVTNFPSNQTSGQGISANEAAPTGAEPISGLPNSTPLNLFPNASPSHGANPEAGTLDDLSYEQRSGHPEFCCSEDLIGVKEYEVDIPEDITTYEIILTAKEAEELGRLEEMGFSEDLVIEVFIACNRNLQLTADYLLEHAGDD